MLWNIVRKLPFKMAALTDTKYHADTECYGLELEYPPKFSCAQRWGFWDVLVLYRGHSMLEDSPTCEFPSRVLGGKPGWKWQSPGGVTWKGASPSLASFSLCFLEAQLSLHYPVCYAVSALESSDHKLYPWVKQASRSLNCGCQILLSDENTTET